MPAAAAAAPAIGAAGQVLGGLGIVGNAIGGMQQAKAAREQARNASTAQVFDSTNPIIRQLAGQQAQFLSGVFGGNNPFAPLQSPLTGVAAQGIQGAIGAPQAGANTIQSAIPFLQAWASGQGLQNPFSGMGATNPGQAVVDAAQPIFARNLQTANTQLANMAPGRFSSAFVQQGQDLNSQAINDFNLFTANALQQGQALQNQQQSQALNFILGAQGLGLDAAMGLGQIGGLQGQQQNDAFGRMINAGNFGLAQQQANVDPMVALMQSGFQFAAPSDLNAIVGANNVRGLPASGGYGPSMTAAGITSARQPAPANATTMYPMNPLLTLYGGS